MHILLNLSTYFPSTPRISARNRKVAEIDAYLIVDKIVGDICDGV